MNERNRVEDMLDDARDTIDEGKHRAGALGEHAKRDVAGDSMSFTDKVKSGLKEAGHKVEAEVDKAKRDARHER